MSNAVRAVNHGEDAMSSASRRERLERHTHARQGGDGVKDGDLDAFALCCLTGNGDLEGGQVIGIGDGIRKLNLDGRHVRLSLGDAEEGLFTSAIDGTKVQYTISWRVHQIPEDGVDTRSGILNEDDFRCGDVQ